jgi:hypothetical protein
MSSFELTYNEEYLYVSCNLFCLHVVWARYLHIKYFIYGISANTNDTNSQVSQIKIIRKKQVHVRLLFIQWAYWAVAWSSLILRPHHCEVRAF